MNRDELQAKATELKLTYAGNISTDKLELLIEEAELQGAIDNTTEVKVEKTEKVNIPRAKPRHELTRGERQRLTKADLMRKERVIVIDKQTQYQVDDAEPAPVRISFRLGQLRDARMVQVDQEPQFLPRGTIQVMRDMPMDTTSQVQGKYTKDSVETSSRKRFIITPAPQITEEEISSQKARENARAK